MWYLKGLLLGFVIFDSEQIMDEMLLRNIWYVNLLNGYNGIRM